MSIRGYLMFFEISRLRILMDMSNFLFKDLGIKKEK